MELTSTSVSQRYATALKRHLKSGAKLKVQSALRIGRDALARGLGTLDLARAHEQALASMQSTRDRALVAKRAEMFFTEAVTPIVETFRAARETQMDLNRLNQALSRRTLELTASRRQLKQGIARRRNAEDALRKSGQHYSKLLKQATQLQDSLRELTHKVIAAQESERAKISRELQNEIAQTLIGINVRLVSLKQESKRSNRGLREEIASTEKLVAHSARSVRKAAHDLHSDSQPSPTEPKIKT